MLCWEFPYRPPESPSNNVNVDAQTTTLPPRQMPTPGHTRPSADVADRRRDQCAHAVPQRTERTLNALIRGHRVEAALLQIVGKPRSTSDGFWELSLLPSSEAGRQVRGGRMGQGGWRVQPCHYRDIR